MLMEPETHSASKTNCANNIANNNANKAEKNRGCRVAGSNNLFAALVAGVTTAGSSRIGGDGGSKGGESDGGQELELHL
jgi:hypothetical protein